MCRWLVEGGILWGGGEGSGGFLLLMELSGEMPPLGRPVMAMEPKARKGTNGLGWLQSWILGTDVGVEVFGTKL